MDNKNNTSLYEHTEEFPFPAMEPDKDEMKCLSISATETMLRSKKKLSL